jgi:hypothetical protein
MWVFYLGLVLYLIALLVWVQALVIRVRRSERAIAGLQRKLGAISPSLLPPPEEPAGTHVWAKHMDYGEPDGYERCTVCGDTRFVGSASHAH